MMLSKKAIMILKLKENAQGFSLLELTVVLIIMTILTSALIPQLVNNYLIKAANKTALDMSSLGEASRAYYDRYGAWPGATSGNPIGDLTSGNYLPSSWQAINPFGFSSSTPAKFNYNFVILGSANDSSLEIYTYVPNTSAQTLIKNLLSGSGIDPVNNLVYSTVTVPGGEANTIPTGSILAWSGLTAPQGYLLCDGSEYSSSSFPNLANIINSGNGTSSFVVPDLRGRSIVGVNPLTVNDGSNRIWSTDNYSNNQGQIASYNVNVLGGVFGEEKHRQTLAEMAPHTHPFASWDYVKGFSGNSTSSPRDPQGGSTGPAGGNGDGSGLGAAANVIQPSVALNYIIKT